MNIVLIGMPGCGKSTCGVLAAKIMCKSFLDTDLLIQQNEGMKLQDIIDLKGNDYFGRCEEESVMTLYARNCVIATGGSMVYSAAAMKKLKENGIIIYLHVSYPNMKKRIKNLSSRGIVLKDGFTLKDMYDERLKLYEKYADVIVDCDGCEVETTAQRIVDTAMREIAKREIDKT